LLPLALAGFVANAVFVFCAQRISKWVHRASLHKVQSDALYRLLRWRTACFAGVALSREADRLLRWRKQSESPALEHFEARSAPRSGLPASPAEAEKQNR
jgi:hypothetical protein